MLGRRLGPRHGSDDYIGEEVSQLEHALQAADLAQRRHGTRVLLPYQTENSEGYVHTITIEVSAWKWIVEWFLKVHEH